MCGIWTQKEGARRHKDNREWERVPVCVERLGPILGFPGARKSRLYNPLPLC
jgi:hypothetical protein